MTTWRRWHTGESTSGRTAGAPPRLILVPDGPPEAFSRLAVALGGTVHVMDGPRGDVAALLDETGAANVAGIGAGAITALNAALETRIERLALFEPPLSDPGQPPAGRWAATPRRFLFRRGGGTLLLDPIDTYDRFAAVESETLLLGGERSPAYLKRVLNGLDVVLPRVRRVTLTGAGHQAAENSGRPDAVAAELRKFFR